MIRKRVKRFSEKIMPGKDLGRRLGQCIGAQRLLPSPRRRKICRLE
jgi:hypothetical protein